MLVQIISWPKKFESNKILVQITFQFKTLSPQKLGSKSLVKIGSLTVEIFPVLTNIARANVTCTNVHVTVYICSRWSQEPIFKVWVGHTAFTEFPKGSGWVCKAIIELDWVVLSCGWVRVFDNFMRQLISGLLAHRLSHTFNPK